MIEGAGYIGFRGEEKGRRRRAISERLRADGERRMAKRNKAKSKRKAETGERDKKGCGGKG
jgi:hypothetical protein